MACFRTAVRSILLDLPLVLLFASLVFLVSFRHIHDEYLFPLMKAAFMTDERVWAEYTYYERHCDETDISTQNPSDVVLKPNGTSSTDDALETLLTHGGAVFPDLIHPSTAKTLREYVLDKNERLSPTEWVTVIAPENRWSFNPGATDHPAVTQALAEISSNPLLRSTLERLLGPNPAVVEFNCITAAAGARRQGWHPDTEASKCHSDHARTYHPQFSLAIPLQDTTPEMGATGLCPGTQMCAGLDKRKCTEHGFQVSTHEEIRKNNTGHSYSQRYWKAGYGLLYNQQTFHRGAAHVDYNAPNRVVFFLTFSSHPQERKESRVPSFGTTYAMRWDMFGFTLNDLRDAKSAMKQPWAKLRALGLYHPPGRDNGWNVITMLAIRIINGEVGYEDGNLDDFLENGWNIVPIDKIPKQMIGDVPKKEEKVTKYGWYEFLDDTLDRFLYWAAIAYGLMLCVYITLIVVWSFISYRLRSRTTSKKSTESKQQPSANGVKKNSPSPQQKKQDKNGVTNGSKMPQLAQNGSSVLSTSTSVPSTTSDDFPKYQPLRPALRRILVSHGIIVLAASCVIYQISTTGWAADIKSGTLYSAIFPHARFSSVTDGPNYDDEYIDIVAAIHTTDAVIGTLQHPGHERAADRYLDYHPGNVVWRNLMKEYTTSAKFLRGSDHLADSFLSWAADKIVGDMIRDGHRFLVQNIFGNYQLMPSGAAKELTRRSLIKLSDGLILSLDEALSSMIARSIFGPLRDTAMFRDEVRTVLTDWREILFSSSNQQQQTHQISAYLVPISDEAMGSVRTPIIRGRSKIWSEHTFQARMSLGQSMPFKISRKICPSSWHVGLSTLSNPEDDMDFLEQMEYNIDDDVEVFPGGLLNQWSPGTIIKKISEEAYDVETDWGSEEEVPLLNLRPADYQMSKMRSKENELSRKIKDAALVSHFHSNIEHILLHSSSRIWCELSGCNPARPFPARYEPDTFYKEGGILLAFS